MKISKASFAAGAVTALVLGSGTAYAATGGNFLLGKSNSAGATTTLTNSNGTALSLNAKSGYAPLKVNRSTKVANLNADKLDGLSSGSFARATGQTGTIASDGGFYADFDGDGWADAQVAVASCPDGTVLTGGGGEDDTAGGSLWLNEAVDTNVWAVASTTTVEPQTVPDGDPSSDIFATAQCYNPKGAVSGATYRKVQRTPLELVKDRLAAKQH